jgi:hypothetical protein
MKVGRDTDRDPDRRTIRQLRQSQLSHAHPFQGRRIRSL